MQVASGIRTMYPACAVEPSVLRTYEGRWVTRHGLCRPIILERRWVCHQTTSSVSLVNLKVQNT
ncbi:hypothetical protein C7459_1284 [Tumebacillus permanentifrigoris]|uniref:Uncharacterized protein n=1 Tax=Tumebacillus permanentifrigoris TaxID=378543 RepID=A0A316DPL2_9BACL|nr:hypothetical protein C7459_1284 [Tumebacillus permanentifrigoris]